MRVAVPPGTPLSDVRRRMVGRGFWFPSPSDQGVVSAGSSRATATITADAVAHTKGAWTQLVAATTKDVTLVTVGLTGNTGTGGTNSSCLLDIGIGGAGSEVVIVPNLAMGYKLSGDRYDIPVLIPAGSRLAARVQHATGGSTVSIVTVLGLLPFGRRPPNHIVAMGADTATSHGVAMTAPSGANTKLAWVEIVASTTEPLGGILVGEQGNTDVVFTTGSALLDIGVGASGSEVVVLGDLSYAASSSEFFFPHGDRNFAADIPMGSRIAARWSTSTTANSMDLIVYGVPRQ